MVRIQYEYGFKEKKYKTDDFDTDMVDSVTWDLPHSLDKYGYVGVAPFDDAMPYVLGNKNTWVECNGKRYSTREDYQELGRLAEAYKMAKLLEEL